MNPDNAENDVMHPEVWPPAPQTELPNPIQKPGVLRVGGFIFGWFSIMLVGLAWRFQFGGAAIINFSMIGGVIGVIVSVCDWKKNRAAHQFTGVILSLIGIPLNLMPFVMVLYVASLD